MNNCVYLWITKLNTMKRILYILYTWIIFVPLFLVLTLLTALTTIVGCFLGGERIFAYWPGRIWSWLTCHLALCPVKVRGRENIPSGQSCIFVSNHQGAFDIFLIYGFLGVPFKWVMKSGIKKIPFVGDACRAAGFIFVEKATPGGTANIIREAEKYLSNGVSIVIFPEGSRTYDGKMVRFRKGAFQLATDLNMPLVPITLNGPYEVLPIASLNLCRHSLQMIIHPAVSPAGTDSNHKGLELLAEQTKQTISAELWNCYR